MSVPKKILQWGLIVFLIFYVATQPANAAAAVNTGVDALQATADGFSEFLTKSTSAL